MRGFLYALTRLMGDVQAVWRGKVGHRLARRLVGREIGRLLSRFFR